MFPVFFCLLMGCLILGFAVKTPETQENDAMMAAMQKAATPGRFHQQLEPLVGTFEVSTQMWMEPGQTPMTAKGVGEHKWVLGKRFLEQRYQGDFMGMPFEGIGYTGYDNIRERYVNTWIDSMGTGFMIGEGKPKADGSIEFWAQYPDPTSGEMVKFREVIQIHSKDHHTLKMFMTGEDGNEFLNAEIHYRRKK
jgi:hypothetical protein